MSGYLPYTATWYSLRDSDYATVAKPGRSMFSAPKNDLIPVFARGFFQKFAATVKGKVNLIFLEKSNEPFEC